MEIFSLIPLAEPLTNFDSAEIAAVVIFEITFRRRRKFETGARV